MEEDGVSDVSNGEAHSAVELTDVDTATRLEQLEVENRQLRASIRGALAALTTFDLPGAG